METSEGDRTAVPAAGVALFDRAWQRLLLARHEHDGAWATVGGRVEPGETAEQAARREVREELGVSLGHLDLLGVFGGGPAYVVHYPGWGPATYTVTMFVGRYDDGAVLRPDGVELREVRWFTVADLATVRLARDMVEIVPAALDHAQRRRLEA